MGAEWITNFGKWGTGYGRSNSAAAAADLERRAHGSRSCLQESHCKGAGCAAQDVSRSGCQTTDHLADRPGCAGTFPGRRTRLGGPHQRGLAQSGWQISGLTSWDQGERWTPADRPNERSPAMSRVSLEVRRNLALNRSASE